MTDEEPITLSTTECSRSFMG